MALSDMMGYTVTQVPGDEAQDTHPLSVVAPAPQGIPSLPPMPPPQAPPPVDHTQPGPESMPLFDALDKGYADKKIVSPVEMIRQGVQLGDMDMVDKGHEKLRQALHGTRSFGERFSDAYFRNNELTTSLDKMAADTVMREMLRPSVESATQTGLLRPNELTAGQAQPQYAHLIPAASGRFSEEGIPETTVGMSGIPAQPGQRPGGISLMPGARLDPIQEELVKNRLEIAQKQAARSAPAGFQELLADVESQVAAHIEKTGKPPTAQDYAMFMGVARGRFNKEDLPGSKGAEKTQEEINALKAKTETENKMRQTNHDKARAEIGESIAKVHSLMTLADEAVIKGNRSQDALQLERARTELVAAKSAIAGELLAISKFDIPDDQKRDLYNNILKLSGSVAHLEKRLGTFGFDIGTPNATVVQGAEKPLVPQVPTEPLVRKPEVSPYPYLPGYKPFTGPGQEIPQAPQVELPLPPQSKQNPMLEEYSRLRRAGLTKEQIKAELEKKFGKK